MIPLSSNKLNKELRLLKAGSRRVQVLSYTEISGCTAQIETMGVVNGAYAGAA